MGTNGNIASIPLVGGVLALFATAAFGKKKEKVRDAK